MIDLYKEILEWPVVVQGAIGAAVFWFVLFAAQKLVSLKSDLFAVYSNRRRQSHLYTEWFKYLILREGHDQGAVYFGALLYLATPRILRGLLWLTLGLAFYPFAPVFGIVGFMGAAFYFLYALNIFRSIDTSVDADERIEQIVKELHESARAASSPDKTDVET